MKDKFTTANVLIGTHKKVKLASTVLGCNIVDFYNDALLFYIKEKSKNNNVLIQLLREDSHE